MDQVAQQDSGTADRASVKVEAASMNAAASQALGESGVLVDRTTVEHTPQAGAPLHCQIPSPSLGLQRGGQGIHQSRREPPSSVAPRTGQHAANDTCDTSLDLLVITIAKNDVAIPLACLVSLK